MKQINMSAIFILVFRILEIFAESTEKGINEVNVYVTNTSSTYQNIPSTCKLYGSDFSGELNGNLTINITYKGRFWIRAGIGFRRQLNPLGVKYQCNSNHPNGVTLDQCTKECRTKYIQHNSKSCHCDDEKNINDDLISLKLCDDYKYGLCHPGHCVVYEKVVNVGSLLCDAYKYISQPIRIWTYTMEDCKSLLPHICDDKKVRPDNKTTSWFLAHHYCKQQDTELLQRDADFLQKYADGRKYWISPFRRQVFLWQSGIYDVRTLCVAGNVTEDGVMNPFIEFCNSSLPALCSVQNFKKAEQHPAAAQNTAMKGVVIGVVCVSAAIIIVIVVIVKRRRNAQ